MCASIRHYRYTVVMQLSPVYVCRAFDCTEVVGLPEMDHLPHDAVQCADHKIDIMHHCQQIRHMVAAQFLRPAIYEATRRDSNYAGLTNLRSGRDISRILIWNWK
jgi:hypothetical protein